MVAFLCTAGQLPYGCLSFRREHFVSSLSVLLPCRLSHLTAPIWLLERLDLVLLGGPGLNQDLDVSSPVFLPSIPEQFYYYSRGCFPKAR